MGTRFVCILSIPRTGSSHLMHLLQACGELNVKGELFHAANSAGLTESDRAMLRAEADGAISGKKTLCEWRRSHARRTLDILHENGNRRPLVFKLFQDHLAKEVVADDILAHPHTGYIVLRRRPIDSYISKMKAAVSGKHARVDTTVIRPELEPGPFLFWARRVRDWYGWLEDEIGRRALPCSSLSFERHIENRTAEDTLAELRGRLEALGCAFAAAPQEIRGHARQDLEPDYRHRVANWPEFEAGVRARSPELLAWALGAGQAGEHVAAT